MATENRFVVRMGPGLTGPQPLQTGGRLNQLKLLCRGLILFLDKLPFKPRDSRKSFRFKKKKKIVLVFDHNHYLAKTQFNPPTSCILDNKDSHEVYQDNLFLQILFHSLMLVIQSFLLCFDSFALYSFVVRPSTYYQHVSISRCKCSQVQCYS